MPRWLGLLGTFLMATLVAMCTVFFAGLTLAFILMGSWNFLLAAGTALNTRLLGACTKMLYQEWWEDL